MTSSPEFDMAKIINRGAEGKKFCQILRIKFETKLEEVTDHTTRLNTIMEFYRASKDEDNEGRLSKYRALKDNPAETKEMCWLVCMEAINRDFIAFVRTGKYGTVSESVYRALSS